ncbi:baseplate protein [Serratia sp. arafor3]|uniref:Baseplate protein n=1 Tax=Serratia silvae TaxID=2824122 RepID=A0ABT0KIK4_9GAMM|nr:baseplate protein [Serratia silvae]
MTTYNRLDDRCIEDPIIRAYLHNEVIRKSNSQDVDLYRYDIKPDEEYRPDLVAHRIWGICELRWCVRLLAGTVAEYEPLPIGQTLSAPSIAWLRERIRHYVDTGELPAIQAL